MKNALTSLVVVLAAACACAALQVDVELETYAVLDGRAELKGQVTLKSDDAVREVQVCAVPVLGERAVWSTVVSLAGVKRGQSAGFSIPVGKMRGGYYRLEIRGATDAMPPPADFRGATVFSIAALREKLPAVAADKSSRRFLSFVLDTMKTLVERQSARLGGEPDGTLFLTCSRFANRSYRSLGYRKDDGSYSNFWFPEMPMDYQPFMVDFDLWPILERLSELTGERSYREMVEEMARAFVSHGFDARSGLGYLGEEASFDVVRKTVVPTKLRSTVPKFKPKNTGNFPAMPMEALWRHGPEQMHRMFRAMYYGLITDAPSMDYNRYCGYDFSDAERRHSMKRNSGHCAFDTAAGRMIHWWASCFAHTGDADCLQWAQRMADKWQAVQHAESGLVPNFFG
ncbi:MAG: hypothetical protein FJ388_09580, partial [Verrucomicrobia bacterium]|nr:hypothetical protein [Verrucomicrobiota bacterium]